MHRHVRLGAAALALGAIVSLPGSTARLGGQAPSGIVAIRNATLLTVTRGTIASGTIVLQNGKIAADRRERDDAGRRRGRRRHRQVRVAGPHRRPLAHRQRRHQRGRHLGQLDGRHGRRARSRPTSTSTATSPAARRRPTSCTAAPTRSAARRWSSSCATARSGRATSSSRARCPASSSRSARTSRASAARRRRRRSGSRRRARASST